MNLGRRLTAWIANTSLTLKLMLPSVTLALVLSASGSFVVSRYVARQASNDLDLRLTRSAVRVEAAASDEVSYLLEAVRASSNFVGVGEGLMQHDSDALAQLGLQTLVLRNRADLSVTMEADGSGIVELHRGTENINRTSGGNWRRFPFVDRLFTAGGDHEARTAGIVTDGTTSLLAVAGPVYVNGGLVGATLVGVRLDKASERIAAQNEAPVAFYRDDGALITASSKQAPPRVEPPGSDSMVRRGGKLASSKVATLIAPFVVEGTHVGYFAVWLPSRAPSFAGLAWRIGAVFLIALVVVGAMGAVITRVVTRQVRVLVETHEDLAHGRLDARVPEPGTDELGRLATAVNTMAEQLQASHSELERRVELRTQELQRLYDESVRASEARAEFFAAISHELRTPLFVILGHAELMSHKELVPTTEGWVQQFGDAITEATQSLLERVNEILELAKIQTSEVALDLKPMSVGDAVSTVAEELAPLARRAGVAMSVETAATLPQAFADEARIRDVLRNLLSNAIKFTPEGGHVRVTALRRAGQVEISVADTGIGIPPEARAHLFEPFYQVPGARPFHRQASSGLGLALAARLVEAHGSVIRVRSKTGAGSSFAFRLHVVPSRHSGNGKGNGKTRRAHPPRVRVAR